MSRPAASTSAPSPRSTGSSTSLLQKGIGVIVISSELPEIIGICDRVLVMREGHMQGEVGGSTGHPITQENIMTYAAGVAAA